MFCFADVTGITQGVGGCFHPEALWWAANRGWGPGSWMLLPCPELLGLWALPRWAGLGGWSHGLRDGITGPVAAAAASQ